MIAFAQPPRQKPGTSSKPAWHVGFMSLLPDILRQIRFAFRRLAPDRREEAIQEALVNALVAYIRLFELGNRDSQIPNSAQACGVRHGWFHVQHPTRRQGCGARGRHGSRCAAPIDDHLAS
jgi:hypothetical protein